MRSHAWTWVDAAASSFAAQSINLVFRSIFFCAFSTISCVNCCLVSRETCATDQTIFKAARQAQGSHEANGYQRGLDCIVTSVVKLGKSCRKIARHVPSQEIATCNCLSNAGTNSACLGYGRSSFSPPRHVKQKWTVEIRICRIPS